MRRLLALAGALWLLYGLGVLMVIGLSHWFDGASVLGGTFLLLIAFFWQRLFPSGRLRTRMLAALLIASLTAGLALILPVGLAAFQQPRAQAAYAIILGAKVNGQVPSLTLACRIEGALDYLKEEEGTLAIATGGQGPGEDLPEGQVIADWLLAGGIGGERILVDAISTTTRENLLEARALIEGAGGSLEEPVVIVSSSYHLYRSQRLAKALGFESVSGKACHAVPFLEFHYILREGAALVKERLLGHL